MRTARPQRIEGNRFSITVENPGQLDLMTQAIPEILRYIHDSLLNDRITIEIFVNSGESAPYTWNEREVLAHIAETTPVFKKFVEEFKLTLS